MDSEASLRTLLHTANFGVRPITAIVDFLSENLTELANMSAKDLDVGIANIHKAMATLGANMRVRLNVSKCILLHSIRLHFHDRISCSAPLNNEEISLLTAADINQMKVDYSESTLDTTATGLGDVKIPKLTHLKWPEFKSALHELLGRSYGQHKIPLLYVTRVDDVGNFGGTYDDRRTKLTMCVSHIGAAYKADNGDVFSILVQHTENTEGASIVQANETRRNGRKAWSELVMHFEGDTYKQRTAQEAASVLKSATYTGPKKNFSFGDYYKLHTSAHAKLLRADKPMTVEQKIDGFVHGLECSTAQTIVVSIAGDPTIRVSFDAYYNAIASRIELANSLTQKQVFRREDRFVNQGKTDRNKKSGGKHGKNTPHKRFSGTKSNLSQNKSYSAAEWKSLTREQQNAVKRHNAGKKALQIAPNPEFQSPIHNARNTYQPPGQLTNYVPPPPAYPRSISNFYHAPSHDNFYGFNEHNSRNVNQFSLPPQPSAIMVPPPPPNTHSANTINANSGSVGQHFGNFGPTPPPL